MTMLEKIARAIAERQMRCDQRKAVEGCCDVLLAIDPYLDGAREDARAAVEAMRELNEAILSVPSKRQVLKSVDVVWHEVIDAILNEKGEG